MNAQSSKKHILIFGGSFDPIHYGHICALQAAQSTINPDLSIIIPNFVSPHKDKVYAKVDEKLEMLNLTFKDSKDIIVDDFEIQQSNPSYFINTLNYLMQKYPDAIFSMLIGYDQYCNFSNWKEYKEIIKKINKILVYPRNIKGLKNNNKTLRIKYLTKFKFLKYDSINISSTEIRDQYVDETYLPLPVIDYINQHGIYGANRVELRNTPKRYQHSLRVAYMCKELAKKYAPSLVEKAYVAGLYHDIAKDMNSHEQERIAQDILNIKEYVSWKVLHPYIGKYLLETNFAFKDQEILQAIARHTLPFERYDSEPSILDKMLYVADKLEPNRTDEDVFTNTIAYFRELANTDIHQCFAELQKDSESGYERKK